MAQTTRRKLHTRHGVLSLLLLLALLGVALLCRRNRRSRTLFPCLLAQPEAADTLFTCTSFVTFPGKLQELRRALRSFLAHNTSPRIREYLVVNEYDDDPTAHSSVAALRLEFPAVRFLHKSQDDRGQARSLNMILEHLRARKYTYWIHWEESWFCTGRMIDDALQVLDSSDLSQLSLEKNRWEWQGPRHEHLQYTDHPKHVHIQVRDVEAYKRRRAVPWYEDIVWWPLFSLRPGIDRVDHVLRAGTFDTSPAKWPVTFEYDFAHRWLAAGGDVGALRHGHVDRKPDHRSTYA